MTIACSTEDPAQLFLDILLNANVSFETKMDGLAQAEASISQLYWMGLTRVKPVSMMTADDLVQ